jgi:serine/threonine-protein kinase
MNRSHWPTDQELRQLLDGSLTADRYAQVEALLDQDDDLRQHLEKIAGGSSWIGRASHSKASVGGEDSDAALLAAIGGLKAQAGAATQIQDLPRGGMTLSFLSPSDVPGSLGRIKRYEVQELIGCGGFGMVLKAHDPKLNRIVAIKVLNPALANHSAPRKRFVREALQLATVKHEDVVTIHEIEEEHQPPFIVMEYVAGISLQELVDREGPLPLAKILRIGSQAAEGLAAAHKRGLIHRDIKPANILLENGVQRVKITDFGLARAVDEASLTQSGVVAGTPQYMAPEQARGETVDYRSDLFSLGSVLYTMCAGRPAFRADSAVAVLKRVCEDEPRPIREVNPEIPDWLEGIVNKLMAKAPNDRFSSSREVADLLDQCLAHIQQPRMIPLPETAAKLSGAAGQALSPSASHEVAPPKDLDAVRKKVAWPGLGLILCGMINLTFIGVSFVGVSESVDRIDWAGLAFVMGLTLASILVMLGGFSLRALRFAPLVWVSSFIAMILGPGLLLGLPSAIWTFVLLTREDVAAAFKHFSGRDRREPHTVESLKQITTPPAIGMMVVAAINFAAIVVLGLASLAGGVRWSLFLAIIAFVVLAPATLVILMGANAMRQLRQWPLALIGAILCILVAPGSIVGLLVGIWSLAMLLRRDVHSGFDAVHAPPLANQPLPKKPAFDAGAPRQRSNGAGLAIAATLMFMLAGFCFLPLLIMGGYFFTRVTVVQPAPYVQPPMVEHGMAATPELLGQLSVVVEEPGIDVSISDLGGKTKQEQWLSEMYQGRQEGRLMQLPASNYQISARDRKGNQIFQKTVMLGVGGYERVYVVPQVDPTTTAFKPSQGQLDWNDVRATIFSPEGDKVAFVLKTKVVRVFNAGSGEEIVSLKEHSPSFAAFSHDHKQIAIVGVKDGETIVAIHNFADNNPKILKPSGKHTDGKYATFQNVKAVAFSPIDDILLVSSAYNWTKEKEEESDFRSMIHCFRLADGEELEPLGPQDGTIDQILFPAKKSDFVASVSNSELPRSSTLVWWKLDSRQTIGRIWELERSIDRIAISPQGGWIYDAVASMNQTLGGADFRQVRAYVTRHSLLGGSDERGLWQSPAKIDLDVRVHELAVSPDGNMLAVAKDLKTIELWRASSPQKLVRLGELINADYQLPVDFTFSSDSKALVMASSAGELKRYDVSRWTVPAEAEELKTGDASPKPLKSADLISQARMEDSTFWSRENGKLLVTTDDKSRAIQFDADAPEAFLLEATFRRLAGDGYLKFDTHAGKVPLQITIDDRPQGDTGIGKVDVFNRSAETCAFGVRIANEQPHVLRCVVRKTGVIATLDSRIIALYEKEPNLLPRDDSFARWAVTAGSGSKFSLDEFQVTPLDQAAAGAPVSGTWASLGGSPDVTFAHEELKSNEVVAVTGNYSGKPITGKYDPVARVVWWNFEETTKRQGQARHYLEATGLRMQGDCIFAPQTRYGADWKLARKTQASAEIDFHDVPAELQKIALLAKTDVERARAQKEAAIVSAEVVDQAEIKLIEALVKAFQAAQRDADAVNQLEQLVAIRRRHVDRVDALFKTGAASAEEGTIAREKLLEAEYRLRQAKEK